jgi:ADP-ribosylglycohydrolase
LLGLAIGDALGMPTQLMRREDIAADYGVITGLVAAGPRQIIAAGLPAGSITDDTEQALLLADLLISSDGQLDARVFADALLHWETTMEAKGSLDLLGPSTKKAIERISAGYPPAESGVFGATNGAAMRIAPVGIAVPPEPLSHFVDAVVAASMVTHNTSTGLAAAAAVGAAVSVGVEGGTFQEMVTVATLAADLASERGNWVPGGQIGARITWVTRHMRSLRPEDYAHELDAVVGTDVAAQESVVAAFGILAVASSPWEATCLGAMVGGDTDTIAAIVGAISGAHAGTAAWPPDAARKVRQVNAINLSRRVAGLLRLRGRTFEN